MLVDGSVRINNTTNEQTHSGHPLAIFFANTPKTNAEFGHTPEHRRAAVPQLESEL